MNPRQRSGIQIGLVAAALVVLGWAIFKWTTRGEQAYHGFTITGLYYHSFTRTQEFTPDHPSEFKTGIMTLGTNALPALLAQVKARDHPLTVKFRALWNRQSLVDFPFHSAQEKQFAAMCAFVLLGTNALPAAPGLIKLTQDKDEQVRLWAISCLAAIHPGKDAIKPWLPALTERLIDSNASVQKMALDLIYEVEKP